MKKLLVGLVATLAFGSAFAQTAPSAPVTAADAPATQDQAPAQTPAPATTPAQPTSVVNTAPRVPKSVIAVGAAGAVALALVLGGSDSDDSPSSP